MSHDGPVHSLSSRLHARQLASAFLSPPEDRCKLQQGPASAATVDVAVGAPWLGTAAGAQAYSLPRRCLQHSGTSFLGLTRTGYEYQLSPPGLFLENGWAHTSDEHQLPLQGFLPRGFGLRLQVSGADHADSHHQVNPIAIAVASMMGGIVIGGGLVAASAVSRQDQHAMETENLAGGGTGSESFVPFQGAGNRMGEEPEETSGSAVGLASTSARMAETSEEASMKAEQSTSKEAKAEEEPRLKKRQPEEEAKSKGPAGAVSDETGAASAAAAVDETDSSEEEYVLGGPSLELGSNPKARAAAEDEFTHSLGGPGLKLKHKKKDKKHKKNKHEKEAE